MKKVIIFGNSSSGKSTLAKKKCNEYGLAHLDLDTLAWTQTSPPERRPLLESKKEICDFIAVNKEWVIEGCYSDLIQFALEDSNELIFMNLSIEDCIDNAKNRPWEGHKYESKDAQDANLEMLIEWISQYEKRDDTFSKELHLKLYNAYVGPKAMKIKNS